MLELLGCEPARGTAMPEVDDQKDRRPDLKTIESNVIDIERGALRAGPISFQISNIASLEVEDGRRIGFDFGDFLRISFGSLVVAVVAAIFMENITSTRLGSIVFVASLGIGVTIAWQM